MNSGSKGQPPVTFSLDGVEYTVDDRRQAAGDVLRLGGLDPADYVLEQRNRTDVPRGARWPEDRARSSHDPASTRVRAG